MAVSTRNWFIAAALVAGTALLICGGLAYHHFRLMTGINNSGSPELASEWKDLLEWLPDPEAARDANAEVQVAYLRNGEWLFGLCRGSHGLYQPGGGTLVVKDSRGVVRAFFGHVCDPDMINSWGRNRDSLKDFYKSLLSAGFVEHELYETCTLLNGER